MTYPRRSEIEVEKPTPADQRRPNMAIDEDSANFPRGTNWPSRLRDAWSALLGRSRVMASSGRTTFASGRSGGHPQALLMESLIGGLPGPAITLDRAGTVLAFNTAASGIAPALRRGEPALITLRLPELVEAIRRAAATQTPQRVEFVRVSF